MKKLALFALVFAAAFAMPRAEAQFSLIPYLGYNLELEGFLVGVGSEFAAPFAAGSLDLAIRPSVEYHSLDGDGASYFQVNGDVLARFSGSPSVAPYAGVGLALAIISFETVDVNLDTFETEEGTETNTELGLNVLGGAEFPGLFDFGMPFAQARYSIVDPTDQLSILAGVKINLGE